MLPERAPFHDPDVPATEILLSREAERVLSAAMEVADLRLVDIRPAQARYQPRKSTTVSYRSVVPSEGNATLVAHGGSVIPGAVVVEDGDVRISVWRFPNDPVLVGLRHAVDADLSADLLRGFGFDQPIRRLRTRSYRPMRRAVIEVVTNDRRLFLKVVRPAKLAGLRRRHEAVAGHLPVPMCLGSAPHLGVLAIEALEGQTVRDVLQGETDSRLPTAAQMIDLLDRLPRFDKRVIGPVQRMSDHTAVLASMLPALADRLERLTSGVGTVTSVERVPVHGDLHPGQVMTVAGSARGLIDIDGVGTGERANDIANMLGYLAAMTADSSAPTAAMTYLATLYRGFGFTVDVEDLQRRVAAAIVGYATIPFIRQQADWPEATVRRISKAEDWIRAGPGTVPDA